MVRNDKLEDLSAFIASLEGDEKALDQLETNTDPIAVRRRLSILVTKGRFVEAADLIRALEPTDTWIELGIVVFGSLGRRSELTELWAWIDARNDIELEMRCAVADADSTCRWAFRNRPDGAHLVPGILTPDEVRILEEVYPRLRELLAKLRALGRVENELASQCLLRCLDICYLLGERRCAEAATDLLFTRKPIPIKLGQAAIQGTTNRHGEVVDRLRAEHPSHFRALFLSAVVEARSLKKLEDAFSFAMKLEGLAGSEEHKEELCELLYELSSHLDYKYWQAVEEVGCRLLGRDAPLVKILRADLLTSRDDNGKSALDILEGMSERDDVRWMRSYANALVQVGRPKDALSALKTLTTAAPSPETFAGLVRLARKLGDAETEIQGLNHLIALEPENRRAYEQLGAVLAENRRFSEAASVLQKAYDAAPGSEQLAVNLAVTYSFAGEIEKAIDVLARLSAQARPTLNVLITKAQILEAAGRAKEAFDELYALKGAYWTEPRFLLLLMNLGYAVGREREANEALEQLQILQQQGVVDEKLMRSVSLDEMREWIGKAAERERTVKRMILEGKMPWIMAAEIQRQVPYWAWQLKTQPLDWRAEAPDAIATYSIYSTNGFRIVQRGGESLLEEVQCPQAGTPVVMDVSALITLHALGMLEVAAQYFGVAYIPTDYIKKSIDHTRRLFPHQVSQMRTAQAIKAEIDAGRIKVVDTLNTSSGVVLDEYSVEPVQGRRCHIIDVLTTLHSRGLLTDEKFADSKRAAHKPATDIKLRPGTEIVAGEATLVSLTMIGVLDSLVNTFHVAVTTADFGEIRARLRAFGSLEEARQKHQSLWATIKRNTGHFELLPVAVEPRLTNEEDDDDDQDLALCAMKLARQRRVSLCVDDRVCQAVLHNENREDPLISFGTDRVVEQLYKSGRISAQHAAEALLQLVEWRYRFVVFNAALLKVLLESFKSRPPGEPLRRIAAYVHDCMQDPGLFGGAEPTTPSTTMAVRLHQTWINTIAELLVEVWGETANPETYAEGFTEWAINEFLPSPPRSASEEVQARIAALVPRTLISRVLIAGTAKSPAERINLGLRAIMRVLGVDEDEYAEIVGGLVRERS